MNNNSKLYEAFQTVCLRSPLLPLQDFKLLDEQENTIATVKSFFETDLGLETLFLTSPDLCNEFKKYLNGHIKDARKAERLENTLLKYYIRLTSRCTPFGLFAGYSALHIGDQTSIAFENTRQFLRNARVDMNYICLLLDKIGKDTLIKPCLQFYPNSSMYKLADHLRYVEYSYKGNKRIHNLVGISTNEYLEKILMEAENGISISKAGALIEDEDITTEQAHDFVEYLIDNQILVSEFEPTVTGKDVLQHLANQLTTVTKRTSEQGALERIKFYQEFIQKIQHLLDLINENKTDDYLGTYGELKSLLKSMDISVEDKHLIQVDLNKTTKSKILSTDIVNDIYSGLEIFSKFSPRVFRSSRTSQTNHQQFKNAFLDRYEAREVDLCEALDSEFGIGYFQNIKEDADYSDLLKTINIPAPKNQSLSDMTWDAKLHTFWCKKFIEATQQNSYEIKLTEEDLAAFPSRLEELGETVSVLASTMSQNNHTYIQIMYVQGTSASKLLGRFGTSSEEIDQLLIDITNKEAELNPAAVVAEIVHLPEARVGNVLLRPANRQYEIPYLAQSNADKEFQVPLNDLTVSLKNDRIILRSKKLGKEVIPYLSNAHNFSYNSLPVYQFLCDLQSQRHLTDIYINLGILYRVANFYPRIVYHNIIIKPATWLFQKTDLDMFTEVPAEEQVKKFQEFCEKFKIPQYVCWMVSDNSLLINTHNSVFVRMFIKEVKNKKTITLQEFLQGDCHSSPGATPEEFANEFIVAFYRDDAKPVNKSVANTPVKSSTPNIDPGVKRKYAIGDEWLYFKLYCGLKLTEKVLIQGVRPFIKKLISEGLLEKWFFIRFSDPDYHLRLRIQPKNKEQLNQIIQIFKTYFGAFEASGEVWKIQTDTYVRELERYGTPAIAHVETIFYHDSNFCLDMLSTLKGDQGEKYRWLLGVKSVDNFFNSFQFSIDDKIETLTFARNGFAIEFNADENLKSTLSKLYIQHKKDIRQLFQPQDDDWFLLLDQQLLRREQFFQKPVNTITELSRNQTELKGWILQYTHMNINRLFKSKRRLHEYVIYDLLIQHYKSIKAITNMNKNDFVKIS
jgi:thiopeptide-type bacteriocin biosynthesis protein